MGLDNFKVGIPNVGTLAQLLRKLKVMLVPELLKAAHEAASENRSRLFYTLGMAYVGPMQGHMSVLTTSTKGHYFIFWEIISSCVFNSAIHMWLCVLTRICK